MLRAGSGANDVVARVGGDEVAVVMPSVEAQTFASHVRRLQAILRTQPLVSASAGGALWEPSMRQSSEQPHAEAPSWPRSAPGAA
jgi:GGDEF domain-containing protein